MELKERLLENIGLLFQQAWLNWLTLHFSFSKECFTILLPFQLAIGLDKTDFYHIKIPHPLRKQTGLTRPPDSLIIR